MYDHVGKTESASQYKLARHLDMVKPIPKSSDLALLKLDYRSTVSTEILNPRCKIFVASTDVINIISLPCSNQSIKIRLALKSSDAWGVSRGHSLIWPQHDRYVPLNMVIRFSGT